MSARSCERLSLYGENRQGSAPASAAGLQFQPRDKLSLQPPRMAQQSVLLAPQVTSVEEGLARWNDATDSFVPDDPRHQQPTTAADTLKADNAQQVNVNKTNHPSILESTPNAPSPISGSPSASIRDSASTHSLPVLQVTEP